MKILVRQTHRTQGTVLLCDPCYGFNPFSKFKIKTNETWKQFSSRKNSYGWIIYEKGARLNKIYPSRFGTTIKLSKVVKYLLGDVGYCSSKRVIAV